MSALLFASSRVIFASRLRRVEYATKLHDELLQSGPGTAEDAGACDAVADDAASDSENGNVNGAGIGMRGQQRAHGAPPCSPTGVAPMLPGAHANGGTGRRLFDAPSYECGYPE